MNYTLNEYASDVVYRIASVCNAREHRAPDDRQRIGPRDRRAPQRAGLQHARHARALDQFRVTGKEDQDYTAATSCRSRCATCSTPIARSPSGALVECYHDAQQAREQALQMFNLG